MQVSLSHQDARTGEILASIRGMFAEKGFDGASMQDLAKAAGMSVGNFYRYFPSKAAIVEAIVTRDMNHLAEEFSAVMNADNPMEAVRQKVAEHVGDRINGTDADAPIWAEIAATAFRKPEIGQAMERMEAEIKLYFFAVFAVVTGMTEQQIAEKFSAHVSMIMMLIKSATMACRTSVQQEPGLQVLILRAIDGVLSEISAHAVKG